MSRVDVDTGWLSKVLDARRGDYRIIYRIDSGRHRVEIVGIEHRSDAYRPR